ncbi:MAG: hypothetical protein GEU99_06045 [Luteitalea sp.]|nr:hypothetical protein [Luteitalea sp.]
MAATARLIVMMEEDEKATLEARAQAAKISTAEFVRRRLFGRGEPEEEALLQVLAELKPVVQKACETIDANLAEIRVLRGAGDEKDTYAAKQAHGDLTRAELVSIAERLQSEPSNPGTVRRRGVRP